MPRHPRPWVLAVVALGLFAMWSNSFIAIAYLLGSDRARPQFDWLGLTVARFLLAGALSAAYCVVFRRAESQLALRGHWRRLVACGLLAVPGYNFALYYGQQHGVPAPIASLTTALVPLFVMVLAAAFLGERITVRRAVGFAIAAGGMLLIGLAKKDLAGASYPALIAITALAPLSWSAYSVISKPMTGKVDPIVWTYLATAIGALMVLPLLPGRPWHQWSDLSGAGWGSLLYLSLPCTVLGFVLWTWLLRHLPASTVGFTVFLNPPLTTSFKYLFALLLPATFLFTIRPLEWCGGALALIGMGIAVYSRGRRIAHRRDPR